MMEIMLGMTILSVIIFVVLITREVSGCLLLIIFIMASYLIGSYSLALLNNL